MRELTHAGAFLEF